jgi:hypothetical protein
MSSIQTAINGQAAAGFISGVLTIDPLNIVLASFSSDPNAQYSGTVLPGDPPAAGTLTLDVNAFSPTLSQINLQAQNNITLNANTLWTLNDPGVPALLSLTAGRNITLNTGSGIDAGNNWSVSLTAGTALASGTKPTTGNYGIYLNGTAFIQTQNGDINLQAANEVQVGWAGKAASGANSGLGSVRTTAGGNIQVTTTYGDVNTGGNYAGFDFLPNIAPPYYNVDPNLGGISTAAGGNVTISAGNNVVSYLPPARNLNGLSDGGTGAFGSGTPGNVTITAGGNVYGHYVVADGTGSVTAGGNVGVPTTDINVSVKAFALSLIDGSWNVAAPNGSIYLQEVRNPNGVFNNYGSFNRFASYQRVFRKSL